MHYLAFRSSLTYLVLIKFRIIENIDIIYYLSLLKFNYREKYLMFSLNLGMSLLGGRPPMKIKMGWNFLNHFYGIRVGIG